MKDIGQEVFQLELPEGWAIHNMFNEDLLTWYRELQFKGQHIEPKPPPDIINKEEEYEVEEVWNYWKWECSTQFLVHWKEYRNKHDHSIVKIGLPHAKEVIQDYSTKLLRQKRRVKLQVDISKQTKH